MERNRFRWNIRHSLIANLSEFTIARNAHVMLFSKNKLSYLLGILGFLLGAGAGYIGVYFVNFPNIFFFSSIQYTVIFWVAISDLGATLIFARFKTVSRLRISGYATQEAFIDDLKVGKISSRPLSRAFINGGPMMLWTFLAVQSISLIVFALYDWYPLFQTGIIREIGIVQVILYFELPVIIIPMILMSLRLIDDKDSMLLDVFQSLIRSKTLNVKIKITTQSKKGDRIEEVEGDLAYIGEELVISQKKLDSTNLIVASWNNVQTYLLIVPQIVSSPNNIDIKKVVVS